MIAELQALIRVIPLTLIMKRILDKFQKGAILSFYARVNELCNVTNNLWLCWLKQTIDLINNLLWQVVFLFVNPFSELVCAYEWTRVVLEKMVQIAV